MERSALKLGAFFLILGKKRNEFKELPLESGYQF